MSGEPNPMEANGVMLEGRTESIHSNDDQCIPTALHLPPWKKDLEEKILEKKLL